MKENVLKYYFRFIVQTILLVRYKYIYEGRYNKFEIMTVL